MAASKPISATLVDTPKLFLLDAMALIYRAHFAFIKNPRVTTKGLNTSAVFGFLNTLLEVITKEKPTHLAIGFDTDQPTFRHVAFEAYKAQRQEQPEDITIAIPLVKRLIEAFNIPILVLDGYEADDVIGTYSCRAGALGFQVYMMTPDKDYCQLVTENVHVYKPPYMGKPAEILGVKEVLEKWEISAVDQVRDILGLMGDASDNIPGIPGVGDKTAKKLIQQYGSIENLLANAADIPGKLGENIRNNGALGIKSKELATIECNVPLDIHPEDLICKPVNADAIRALFEELEFRTMAKRVLGEELAPTATGSYKGAAVTAAKPQYSLFGNEDAASTTTEGATSTAVNDDNDLASPPASWYTFNPAISTINNTQHRYEICKTEAECKNLNTWLKRQTDVCFDTETTGLDTNTASIVGLSFCYNAGHAYYVPVPEDSKEAQVMLDIFKDFFEDANITKTGQNIKYDIAMLASYGIVVAGPLFDTMIAHYLLQPDQRHNMDALAREYLGYTPVSIETLIGAKGKNQGNMREVPLYNIAQYAAEDADVTWQLKQKLAPQLAENQLQALYTDVEAPLIQVLSKMEREGIRVNIEALFDISQELAIDIAQMEEQVYLLAGETFNVASPMQLGKILFDKLKLDPKAKKTKSGQYATGEEILSRLAYEHDLPRIILEYRELVKLKNTYVDTLPTLVNPVTGRIHTSYNQTVAATGRLSSTNPNLQNIPIRTAKGREIRKAFVARDENHVLLSADYSQIELRIMAAFANDTTMIEAFKAGKDIHAITASKLYKIPLEAVDTDMRRKAKTANFGIIYGISAFGLSQRLSIPRREAAEIIENYFIEFPGVKRYMDSVINDAKENLYVTTLLGRRRYLPNINSGNMTERGFAERNAINAPIQGSAADIIKIAMINIQVKMEELGLKSRMILQVHDELVFDCYKPETEQLKALVEDLMVHAVTLVVPMEVGMGTGANWLEAH